MMTVAHLYLRILLVLREFDPILEEVDEKLARLAKAPVRVGHKEAHVNAPDDELVARAQHLLHEVQVLRSCPVRFWIDALCLHAQIYT